MAIEPSEARSLALRTGGSIVYGRSRIELRRLDNGQRWVALFDREIARQKADDAKTIEVAKETPKHNEINQADHERKKAEQESKRLKALLSVRRDRRPGRGRRRLKRLLSVRSRKKPRGK